MEFREKEKAEEPKTLRCRRNTRSNLERKAPKEENDGRGVKVG